jgi:lipoprotein-releasing system ATP-binding protein
MMPQLKTQTSPPTPQAPATILRAANLARSFKMGESVVEVLKRVDLTVRAGEFLAIEGRSGSGKSTLLHILGVLDKCDKGQVHYEGADIASLSSAARGRIRNTRFGFVFQFYHLLPELNVLENTLLGPMIELSWLSFLSKRSELRKKAADVLAQLGMDHRLRHRPSQLSGGERQRVAIARALMNSPHILFADEPTGNLDAETGRQIMEVLENLHRNQNLTVIMVTHDRTLAKRADRILLLRDGVLESADKE